MRKLNAIRRLWAAMRSHTYRAKVGKHVEKYFGITCDQMLVVCAELSIETINAATVEINEQGTYKLLTTTVICHAR